MQTSRSWILDLIELIGNQIALTSHLQEQYDEDKNEETMLLLKNSIAIRKDAMSKLQAVNKDYRCSLKHAIASWMYSLECYYAEQNNKELAERCSEQMYAILSKYLGEDMTFCGRCLNDKLLSNKTIEDVM